MDEFIHYFSNIPPAHRSIILAGGISIFWLLENAFPQIKLRYNKWQHAVINLFFTATTVVINFLLAFLLIGVCDWTAQNNFGILRWTVPMHPVAACILGLLLLDFTGAYAVHYFEHKIPLFWRFHLIHHSDTWIDTTSANRHHPGESVLRFIFTCLGVLITGCPIWMVFLYQTLSLISTQFSHANLRLPDKIDQLLSYVIVTPNMHKVHHHYRLPFTDSNYGNIFSIWDRLLGTFMVLKPDQIIYGIDTYPEESENNQLSSLLKMPFNRRRSAVPAEKN